MSAVETPATPEASPDSWGWDPERWKRLQTEEPILCEVKEYLEQGTLPNATERLRQLRED